MIPKISALAMALNAFEMIMLLLGIFVLTGGDLDRTSTIFTVLIGAGLLMSLLMRYRFSELDRDAVANESTNDALFKSMALWFWAGMALEVGALLLIAAPHFALAYVLFRIPFLLISAKIIAVLKPRPR